ncbi:predicted nucleic-acid-binding protein, contains PIN domain protein [Cryptobacterium curtum DSM 15641]|uniref:Predicted nucleic-acid-binding protein, contains PIN domain protein n=1 Tax=Cryptobacterium curtum (strain ATCC 700683 / DSM 15641 / CCUG 43107 / 12-3) TaxID=469378 RepID=C7MLL6_CRYCD|nr:type II toxin-antitoxin system VapC family toxin [Cryptobacterium curtum]ACU93822.1 predicted nucleic-acid-binding protein, contains PIN domain protein [Cryptobacterium curtum DSM 15641]
MPSKKINTIIDETVILRYLLNDNKAQARQARKIIETGIACTYPEIIARVAVCLRDVHRVPRTVIAASLIALLDEVNVPEEAVVRYASRLFGSSPLDYVDCLMVARNTVSGIPFVSFDKPIMKRTFTV